MSLDPAAAPLADAIWWGVFAVNLVGVGLMVLVLLHAGGRPEDEPGGDWRRMVAGVREVPAPVSSLVSSLPESLENACPACRIVARGGATIDVVHPVFSRRFPPVGVDTPGFTRGRLRVEEATGGGSRVHFRLDYTLYRRSMARLGWIMALFLTLPNLVAKVPLDAYVRRLDPSWAGNLSWIHLFHVAWPLLVWLLYVLNLKAGDDAIAAAVDSAGAVTGTSE